MKKFLTLITLLLFLTSTKLSVANHALFSYDQEKINSELVQLVDLENYISTNENNSAHEILSSGNIALTTTLGNPTGPAFGIEDVEWGSFAWGFCCWPVGIFTVILNDEKDKNHKISYFAGIVTSAIIGAIGRVTYNILYLTV